MPSINPKKFLNIQQIIFVSNKGTAENLGSTSKLAVFFAKKFVGDRPFTLSTHYNHVEGVMPILPLIVGEKHALLIGDVNVEGAERADPKLIEYLQSNDNACAIFYTANKATLKQSCEDIRNTSLENRVICCEGSQLGITCTKLIEMVKNLVNTQGEQYSLRDRGGGSSPVPQSSGSGSPRLFDGKGGSPSKDDSNSATQSLAPSP